MATKKTDYIYAAGKRKRASARVRLHKGNKENMVNNQVIGRYFPGDVARAAWQQPFEITGTSGKYYITAKVAGGGKDGQLSAVAHATAKAFVKLDTKKFRIELKKAGLLTRDARKKERRMVGTGGKARKQKQSPKR